MKNSIKLYFWAALAASLFIASGCSKNKTENISAKNETTTNAQQPAPTVDPTAVVTTPSGVTPPTITIPPTGSKGAPTIKPTTGIATLGGTPPKAAAGQPAMSAPGIKPASVPPNLKNGIDIAGKVLDAGGKPVGHLKIQLVMSDPATRKNTFKDTASDGSGKFLFSKVPMTIMPSIRISPSVAGYAFLRSSMPPKITQAKNGLFATLKVTKISSTLSGTVLDPAGKPLANAMVKAYDLPGAEKSVFSVTKTNAAGKFSLPTAKRHEQLDVAWISVHTSGYPSTWKSADLKKSNFTIKMPAGVAFSGVVKDPSGKGVPDSEVMIATNVEGLKNLAVNAAPTTMDRVKTDAKGAFSIAKVANGKAIILVTCKDPRFTSVETQINISNKPINTDLQLKAPGTITGKVVDSKTGKPLANVQLAAYPARPKPDDMSPHYLIAQPKVSKSGNGGEFSLVSPPGKTVVMAFLQGYGQAQQEVDASSGSATITLKMEPGGMNPPPPAPTKK